GRRPRQRTDAGTVRERFRRHPRGRAVGRPARPHRRGRRPAPHRDPGFAAGHPQRRRHPSLRRQLRPPPHRGRRRHAGTAQLAHRLGLVERGGALRRLACAGALACLLAACSPTPDAPADTAAPASAPASPEPPPAPAASPAVEPAPKNVPAAADATRSELPGTLGPLTTEAELTASFCKDNLREESFPGPEGDGSYPVLAVYPDDPRRRLELVLDADDRDAPIRSLRVSGAGSLWHAASGLRPGMRLAELVELNGAPVSFYGLDWDYGGGVQEIGRA